ncbi:MAG: Stp1/IreP family PP2C-type Ser/Thr phosphatase [Coriobacteriales bacterium]|jgi:serine/threonine protein phosphatase PrpC
MSSPEQHQIPQLYASRTDVGCVREHNEDSIAIRPPLFVVADGMGGHEAGEVASAIASETMLRLIPDGPDGAALGNAVVEANKAVLRGAEDGTGRPGMGTTITAALIYDDQLIIAQVGDSRAYLLHNGKLQRITRDHSLVADLVEQGRITEEEARFHPQRSVITRALGSDPDMQPDLYNLTVEKGDRLMLCSDGLSSMVEDRVIASIMASNPDPTACCNALVDEAIAAGGLDNVTVVVVDPLKEPEPEHEPSMADAVPAVKTAVTSADAPEADAEEIEEEPSSPKITPDEAHDKDDKDKKPQPNEATAALKKSRKERRKGRRAPIIWAIVFVLVLLCAGGGFYAFAQNSYYLIDEGGYVAVYRGLPGEFAGLKFSWLEEQTDISVDQLAPTTQTRLEQGISVDSLDAANSLLEQYRSSTEQDTTTTSTDSSTATTDSTTEQTTSSSSSSANE